MILTAIEAYWDYQKADREPGHIGMSAAGHCAKQLAYMKHSIPGKPLDWRAKVIFDDGDLHHNQIRKAIREGFILQNSCYSLIGEEQEVTLGELKGHVDGIIMHDDEKCKIVGHQTKLLEVKSMNSFRFAETKRSRVLSYEYRAQVSAYLRATGYDIALIVCKNKDSGEMLEFEYRVDDALLDSRLEALTEVYSSQSPEDISREWTYSARTGELPWQCNYCPYVELCWRHEGVQEISRKKYAVPVSHADAVAKKRLQTTDDVTEIVNDDPPPVGTDQKESHGTQLATTTDDDNKTKRRKRRKKGGK